MGFSRRSMFVAWLALVGLLGCAAMAAESEARVQLTPEWIWVDRGRHAGAHGAFRATFDAPAAIRRARLRLAADFCRATVSLGGKACFVVEDYAPWIDVDVTNDVRRGTNTIDIDCTASGGPPAIAVELVVIAADGSSVVVRSGPEWQARLTPVEKSHVPEIDSSWRPAVSYGHVKAQWWGIGGLPVATTPFDDYEQWREAQGTQSATDPSTFLKPEGFEVDLLRTAAADEGSWVAVACDERGRLIVAREERGLLRMRLAADAPRVESVETIDDTLEECRGLLFAHGALYVNANVSKAVYRLRDTDGDDTFDEVRLLRSPGKSGGHGMNQIALGPDGLIYAIHGDAVEMPAVGDMPDRTSPFREARRGMTSKEGHLLRTNADASQWELVAAGLRNPFGVAFHPTDGEPFTYDADAEFDMGSAWYRPTRVLHLVSGADFGWRGVTGKWPPYYPDHADNALPVATIGHGSPTAVRFGAASHFPPRYRDALYILDWAYGRVIAVHLVPRGASYTAVAETFLRGRPLNVTGIDFGTDGAMYLVTGGRGTQSALYRVSYTGNANGARDTVAQDEARAAHSAGQRALRRQLEAWHGVVDDRAVDSVWPHLGSADPAIRYAARTALEHQPVASWRKRALAETDTPSSITALLALARSADARLAPQVVARLNALDIGAATETFKRLAMQAYALSLDVLAAHDEPLDAALAHATVERLRALVPPPDAPVVFAPTGMDASLVRPVCHLLVRLGSPEAVPIGLAELRRATRQEDQMHYLHILATARSGWTHERRVEYFTALNAATAARGGQGMPGFLASIRADAVAALSDNEHMRLGELRAPPLAPASDEPAPTRAFVRQWRLDELAGALDDTAAPRDLERGRRMFTEALCSRCHRLGTEGQSYGPDLTSLAGRFTRRDMLESILAPSKVVADSFRNMEVVTTDGRILIGRVMETGDYRLQVLRVATDALRPWITTEVPKSDVEHYAESLTSPMPEGLLNTLSQDEILDLLAYLESGGSAPAIESSSEQ